MYSAHFRHKHDIRNILCKVTQSTTKVPLHIEAGIKQLTQVSFNIKFWTSVYYSLHTINLAFNYTNFNDHS
jgi:hypothetical protein